MNLFEGDIGGAAGAGAGAFIGSAFGPIGSAVGSFIGDAIFGGGGGCFITTAVCLSGNRPDDCHELTTLRNFRDTCMYRNHPEDIKQYYEEAPTIVSSISMREDAARIFAQMDRDYIQPAVAAVEAGEYVIAYEIYKNLFTTAKEIANGS
jgi:phage tail tape-measure protein